MARSSSGSTSNWLNTSSSPVSGVPLTLAGWFNCASAASLFDAVFLSDSGGVNYYGIYLNASVGSTTGPTTTAGSVAYAIADSGGELQTSPANSFTSNGWNHVAAVSAATNNHACYLNGGTAGTSGSTRTVSAPTFASLFGLRLGTSTFGPLTGSLGEWGVWNAALTAQEIASLAAGVCPLLVRPANLVAYWPLLGEFSPEIDPVGRFQLTVNGTLPAAAHPPVSRPFVTGVTLSPTVFNLATNLTAAWEMSESGGQANDLIGGTTGVATGNPPTAAGAAYPTSRQLNGTSQTFTVANSATVQTGNIDFTLEAWVYLDSTVDQVFVGKDSVSGRDYTLDLSSARPRFYINGGGVALAVGPNALTVGQWYQLVGWHDSVNDLVGIRVNGSLTDVSTTGTTGIVPNTTSTDLRLGSRVYVGSEGYTAGRLGPVRFWKNRVVTQAEANWLYNAGSGRTLTGITGSNYQATAAALSGWFEDAQDTKGWFDQDLWDVKGWFDDSLLNTAAAGGSGAGSASGVGTATGAGASTAASAGSTTGLGTAAGIGSAISAAAGSASGVGTATAAGIGSAPTAGSAAGVGTAAGTGASTAASTASAAGVGAGNGVGASSAASAGSAAGVGTAAGAGNALFLAAGSASGVGTATGTGGTAVVGTGSAAGLGTAAGVGAAVFAGSGSTTGLGTAAATGSSTAAGAGSTSGLGTATASGARTAAAAGSTTGLGTATGVGPAVAASAGSAAGVGSATGVSSGGAASVGSAAGVGTATGVGAALYQAAGSTTGFGTATGTGARTAAAAGASSGLGTVSGVGSATWRAAGSVSGLGTAAGAGAATVLASGAAAGVGSAVGTGNIVSGDNVLFFLLF